MPLLWIFWINLQVKKSQRLSVQISAPVYHDKHLQQVPLQKSTEICHPAIWYSLPFQISVRSTIERICHKDCHICHYLPLHKSVKICHSRNPPRSDIPKNMPNPPLKNCAFFGRFGSLLKCHTLAYSWFDRFWQPSRMSDCSKYFVAFGHLYSLSLFCFE